MGQAAHAGHGHGAQGSGGGHGHAHLHSTMYYVKIWAVLLVLLAVSLIGPELGHRWLTIITAFGIAIVKALMVAAYFMHLNVERRYIWYMMFGMLLMVSVFYFGVSADINKTHGSNWINKSALQHIEENQAAPAEGEHHKE